MNNISTTQAELELNVIRKIMDDSRQTVMYNGIHFIFWGVLVSVCLIINYLMLVTDTYADKMGLLWMILMPAGAVVDALIGRRIEKTSSVTTFAGRLLGSLWMASGIAMFMIGFIGVFAGAYKPVFICPIISTILGVSYFTSGSIQQVPWLRNLSFLWWAGAIVMFYFPGSHTLLVFAVMMLGLQVLPGLLLNRKYKIHTQLRQA